MLCVGLRHITGIDFRNQCGSTEQSTELNWTISGRQIPSEVVT